jgi:hypothetical protein
MATRGLFGFFYKGKYYVVFNHFDSYPEGLGRKIVKELKEALKDGLIRWIQLLSQIKIINAFDGYKRIEYSYDFPSLPEW